MSIIPIAIVSISLSLFCVEAGFPQPKKVTIRTPPGTPGHSPSDSRVMDNKDLLSCNYNYDSFLLAGPDYPVIGVGDRYWKGGKGCGQCVRVSYGKKSIVGVVADYCPPGTCEFDVSPKIANALGWGYNNPTGKVRVQPVSCFELKQYSARKLRYVFGAGSKDTSLELIVLGAPMPISSVKIKVRGKVYSGKWENNKWRFHSGTGFNVALKRTEKIQFIVSIPGFKQVRDSVSLSSITSKSGGGSFFEASRGGSITTDNIGNNQVNPPILNWPAILDGRRI